MSFSGLQRIRPLDFSDLVTFTVVAPDEQLALHDMSILPLGSSINKTKQKDMVASLRAECPNISQTSWRNKYLESHQILL